MSSAASSKKKMDWSALLHRFPPLDKSPSSRAARLKIFHDMDPNSNGYLSLAELDKGCRDVLKLYEVFDVKPVILRAYEMAKDFGEHIEKKQAAKSGATEHKKKAHKHDVGADYVEKKEFRVFLVYLFKYFELWSMFDEVDKSHDHRISMDEFKQAVPLLAKWGVKVTDPTATFKQVDKDGGGMLLFAEFADWALKLHLEQEDDHFDDEALHEVKH